MPGNFTAPSGPVLHWIFKTASGGTDGVLVIEQTAFNAMRTAMTELKAEKHELTVMQGSTVSVPVKLSLPLADGVLLQFPTKKVEKKKKKKRKKTRERTKPNGKSNGKKSNGAAHSKRPSSLRARTRDT